VVICNYNKKNFVMDCIASVLKSTHAKFDLFVVDNASTDGSADAVREKYENKLTILVNEENLGGAGGFHRGMQYAAERKQYKYIYLLDNDVVIDENAISELYRFMETHPQTGVGGSLILRMDQPDLIQEYGSMVDVENLGIKPLYFAQKANIDLPQYIESDCVPACSAMYRTSVLEKSGIIDKNFFIYWDDIALCWEIRNAGYKVHSVKKSKVWHMLGFGDHLSTFGKYYVFRNQSYTLIKYCSAQEYERLCENLVKRLFRMFAVNRNNPEIISTYFHALDDVINHIRGKADSFKILPIPPVNEKFTKVFSDQQKILIICKTFEFNFDRLINKIKSVTDASVYIDKNGYEVPIAEGIEVVSDYDRELYDTAIIICNHVLDEENYDRKFCYIDRHMNQILDTDDFDFVENLEMNYSFFHSVFYGFIKSKCDVLRVNLRNGGQ